MLFSLDSLHRDGVDLPDGARIPNDIGQHSLPVTDVGHIVEWSEDDASCRGEQESIAGRGILAAPSAQKT